MNETVKIEIRHGNQTLFVIGGLPVGFAVTVSMETDGLMKIDTGQTGPIAAPVPWARAVRGSEPTPAPQDPTTGTETAPGPRGRAPHRPRLPKKVPIGKPRKRTYHFKPGAKRGLHNHNPDTCKCRFHVAQRQKTSLYPKPDGSTV